MAFQGSARFELVQKLGEGGMGVVYEAFDRERDMRVALKTLRNLDASSLYRFKREFRSLSDVSHPNIIGLYELVSERDDWFFTMELVEGNDFISYLRPDGFDPTILHPKRVSTADSPVTLETRVMPNAPSTSGAAPDEGETEESAPRTLPRVEFATLVDERRLRRAFAQLGQALDTLHRAGMVHRDLKPSNIRVTPSERVVLMDFGIVAELTIRGSDESSDSKAVGTPAYMAPEQAAGEPASAAADWYSFGVVLFLAITGRLPFAGRKHTIMMDKQTREAPSANQFAIGVPEDLAVLCADLLERRPHERLRGYEVLSRLGVVAPDAAAGIDATTVGGLTHFVGREPELARLHEAYAEMRDGKTVATFVVGTSGMGKSTLVRRFLHEVEAKRGARDMPVVLRGRCHERESLPYKAFDTVVDNLSHFLMGLSEERVATLLPDEVDLVTRLFPVLRRVPGVQTARPLGGLDPHELRIRAFGALREMLRRIADWRPLVFYIDDLQWADPDSLDLLLELTREPLPPRFLLVAAVRAENIMYEGSRAEGVIELMNEIAARHTCERITIGGLSEVEQRQLVHRLLGDSATPEMLELRYWQDSAGSPFFLGELVRHAQESVDDTESSPPRLEDVLLRRVDRVTDTARVLLEATAVAGEPMSLSALASAIDMNPVEAERASAILRVGHLARIAKHGQDPWLTSYHDRVRETVSANLPAERRRELHERIAQALERAGDASVDALARHWLAAGDPQQARSYLVTAAQNAQAKLAFGRAADLYQAALDVTTEPDERRPLLRSMADALATAGRHYEAATAYERAAEDADDNDAVDLTRLAADNLLRCGRIVEGLEALQRVISDLGLRIPATRRRALAALVLQRARIALRGYRFKARAESEIPARDLGRLDTLYAASTCIGMIDHIRGAAVQTRHLVQSLKFGEERRVCRALAIEVVFRSSFGGRNLRKAEAMQRDVELMARRIGDPYLIGVAHLAQAAVTFFSERVRLAAGAFAEAERIFTHECVGAEWERLTAAYFHCTSKILLGELADMTRFAARYMEEAERRRNRYAQTLFRSYPSVWTLLSQDKPEEALDKIDTALEGWPTDVYYMSHNFVTINRVAVLIYMGRQQEALELLAQRWRPLHQSMIARLPMIKAEFGIYLAYAGIVCGDEVALRRAVKSFDDYRTSAGRGLLTGVKACRASRAGDADTAQKLLLESIHEFDQAEFKMYAHAYRYRLGELTGGSEGERLRTDARDAMRKQGVVNPERLIGMYAPQFTT